MPSSSSWRATCCSTVEATMAMSRPAVSGIAGAVTRAPGSIELVFARAPGGVSYVVQQYAGYPFHVCRTHRFAGDPAGMVTLYIQSCAGGIFEHDRLHQAVAVETGAKAHVTSQASTIVHGMDSGNAVQEIRLVAEAGAFLEFLPDPLILFPQARLKTRLVLRAHPEATIIADSFLMHDPTASGRVFDWLANEIGVEAPTGETVALDRSIARGATMAAGLPGIGGRFRAHGSLVILHRSGGMAQLLDALRGALADGGGLYAGVSTLPGGAGAWVRLLAEDGVALRAGLEAAWSAARLALTGAAPSRRRK